MNSVFVFHCKDNANIFAYTTEETGKNLPSGKSCLLRWQYIKKIRISVDPYSLIGENPLKILEAIAKEGYYISGK